MINNDDTSVARRFSSSLKFLPPSAGAIYLDNGSGGKTLTVKDSVFYASAAGRSGGAIYLYSSGGYALITDSVFAESESTQVG